MKARVSLNQLLKWVTPIWVATVMTAAGGLARADEDQASGLTADEERIVKRLKEEIMRELESGGLLQQQIEIGIQNYVRKQQQARADAQRQQRSRTEQLAQNVRPVSAERDHVYGNPDAPVSLIEYSDFECPFCKRFHPTAKKLVEAFDGKLNWVYRHFPLSFHNPGAQKQAEASECAGEIGGNDAFWKYTDTIYERTTSGGRGFPIDKLVPLAVELGMDEGAFRSCLESGKHAQRVQEDFEEGKRVGITGTPGNIFLDSRSGKVIARPGAQPFDVLKADVDRLLSEQ